MLFSINFNQKELLHVMPDADAIDAIIIAGLQSMFGATSKKIKRILVDNTPYVWIAIDHLKKELPIVGIKSKRGFLLRMEKLLRSGIIVRVIDGNKSYYTGGDKRDLLWYKGVNENAHSEAEADQVGTTVHTGGMNHSSHYPNTNINPITNKIISKDIIEEVADATPTGEDVKIANKTLDSVEQEETLSKEKEKDSAEKEKEKPVEPIAPEKPNHKEKVTYDDAVKKYKKDLLIWELSQRVVREGGTTKPQAEAKVPNVVDINVPELLPETKPKKGPDPNVTAIISEMDKKYPSWDPGTSVKKRRIAYSVYKNLIKHKDVIDGKKTGVDLFKNILSNLVRNERRKVACMNLHTFNNNLNKLTEMFYKP